MLGNNFTERAQRVLIYAKEEAESFKHGYVGTEHILLGILRENGLASNALKEEQIDIEDVRELIEEYEGTGEAISFGNEIPLTPRTKRLIEISFIEARNLGHNLVTPEHILLALIKEQEGVAFTILANLGADLEKIQKFLIENFNGEETPGSTQNYSKEKSKTPTLDKYGRDLTQMAREGKLDPVIGRDKETERILEILCRRTKNNPCFQDITERRLILVKNF